MVCTSFMFKAYFRRFLRKTAMGRDSDILMRRCFMMVCTSFMFKAYFRRFLRKTAMGRDSDILRGPELVLMANTPPSLSSIHALGALRRFKCFLGPRGIFTSLNEVNQ